ncbi:hypothetical protein ES332_D05G012600v1 [Gossypium tomentosum]|uniref:CUE domain-containing protein n=1 Tax=Gossypium tomentosum TaxID=34277 RepID=A0A5D2KQ09_GOSTO|nr:hypothetical protein ES332_D05G012600v1 [Gossypium tomentosum]TYH68795.1 hypothetical protein ES332_D05G012600v1 [Gossypium tomentosum]TYH68796.1 hypothetical protein ES332_D05G012600v1 [Gossypium tomentosum]
MKPEVSSLNPYAASYIPLAKREGSIAKDIKAGNESAWFDPSSRSNASLESAIPGIGNHPVALKSNPGHGSLMQNQGEMSGEQIMDEEFDMDLQYLRMMFPGLSNDSVLDVYMANNGDLEASIDMLNQLEMYTVESSDTLPDTLDIGDISESISSANCGTLKLKNVASESVFIRLYRISCYLLTDIIKGVSVFLVLVVYLSG